MSPPPAGVRVVLLDIEGTTTPIAFVHQTLFEYARAHLDEYLADHLGDAGVQDAVRRLAREHEADRGAAGPAAWRDDAPNARRESAARYARWLMDRDRKSPGLKQLQGLIWDEGYRKGELKGEIYDDVPRAFGRWKAAGLGIAIYSSGSELAQRRLFGSTAAGDLTPFIDAFFDTAVGAKTDADSYRRIAGALGRAPAEILFVSDVTVELSAAREAGCPTRLCRRPGNAAQPDEAAFYAIGGLDEL